jgi:hypothetical protein
MILDPIYCSVQFASHMLRLQEHLEKQFWRVEVMMRVQALKLRGVPLLMFLEEKSVMKFLQQFIWFDLM